MRPQGGIFSPSPYSFTIRSRRRRLFGGLSDAARPNSPPQVERSRRSTSNSAGGFSEERSRESARPSGPGKAASRTLDRPISPYSTRDITVAFKMKILRNPPQYTRRTSSAQQDSRRIRRLHYLQNPTLQRRAEERPRTPGGDQEAPPF